MILGKSIRFTVIAMSAILAATAPLSARDVSIVVDGRSKPWEPGMNPRMAFGQDGARRPVYVWNFPFKANANILLTATGVVNVLPDTPKPKTPNRGRSVSAADIERPSFRVQQDFPAIGALSGTTGQPDANAPLAHAGAWGPAGQPFVPTDGRIGALGSIFPSYHMPAKSYPVQVNALVGAFVDADGVIIGKPFKIGERTYARVPLGTAALALGLNAENFGYNRGAYVVTVSNRVPVVTVEPAPDGAGPQ